MENRFSGEIQRVLDESKKQAIRHGSSSIQPSHVLLAMLADTDDRPARLLSRVTEMDVHTLKRQLDEYLYTS